MFWKRSPVFVLLALLAIHVLAHVDRNMLLAFAPAIVRDLHLSNTQYGLLVGAVWVLSYGVMAVVMGALADRFSRPRVIGAGLLVWSVCTAVSGNAQTFEQMVAARFLVATGEAALVPSAISLLTELFSERRRGGAIGLFFIGIPVGIGLAFVLAGALGAAHGWRDTFKALGLAGMLMAAPLLLLRESRTDPTERGAPLLAQVRSALALLRANAALRHVIIGFVVAHAALVGLAFTQLWLVRERGFDAHAIAGTIGWLQMVFGALGAALGGYFSDRLASRLPGGNMTVMVFLVASCTPLMVAGRLTAPGSPLFYVGLCAGFFLPLALYGPANVTVVGHASAHLRATVTGLMMLLINIFAIALGAAAVGAATDYLARIGAAAPLTAVLLATDLAAGASLVFFVIARRDSRAKRTTGALALVD